VDPDSLYPDPGSRISSESGSLNFKKNNTAKEILYLVSSKIAIYLSLGFLKGRPRYRRSLQPSK
jgi:hypothetical protein